MALKFDTYSRRARVYPVFIVLAPVALTLTALLPGALGPIVGGSTGVLTLALSFLAGELGRDSGKKKERGLWRDWGGPPTTRFLRYRDRRFNGVTRGRVHAKLRTLGLEVPTEDEEAADPCGADEKYAACTSFLISKTRDSEQFPLLSKELTAYGFRRNLWGLKPIGLSLAALGSAVVAWHVWTFVKTGEQFPAVAFGAGLMSLILLLCWVFWVGASTIRITAEQYARFLFEATESIEPPEGGQA